MVIVLALVYPSPWGSKPLCDKGESGMNAGLSLWGCIHGVPWRKGAPAAN
jgi:hypothetical protein